MHCSRRKVSQVVNAMRHPNYQESRHIHFPQVEQGAPNKVPNKISRYIETLSLLDATLTHCEIRTKIIGRFDVTIGESTVSSERQNLRFHFRRPMVEENLTWLQRHCRLQFALDIVRIVMDFKKVAIS
jgi:hypothetical protein